MEMNKITYSPNEYSLPDAAKQLSRRVDSAEEGYMVLDNNGVFIAEETVLKNCTADMLHWWCSWFPQDPDRYSQWNPETRKTAAVADIDMEQLCKADLPSEEKYKGTVVAAVDNFGMGDKNVIMHFLRDSEMNGVDPEALKVSGQSLIGGYSIVSTVGLKVKVDKVPRIFLHFLKDTEEGVLVRSRYWLGYRWNKKIPMCVLQPGEAVNEEEAKLVAIQQKQDLLHLAEVLPGLYEANK